MSDAQYDVFLSHNSQDKPHVEHIFNRLKSEARLCAFLDSQNLIPGAKWIPELEHALRCSRSVAVFIGSSGTGPWHDEEMQVALIRAVRESKEFRVIPVLLPGGSNTSVPAFLQSRTWVDFTHGVHSDIAFKRLVAGILGKATEFEGMSLPNDPAPYRGLLQFNPEHARFFYGRVRDIGPTKDSPNLVDKLRVHRFVAVIGASGSGKSSLVGAGLLPLLTEDVIPGSRTWKVVKITPADNPWRSVAVALSSSQPADLRARSIDTLLEQFHAPNGGLRHTFEAWFSESAEPVLLFIDQFEELFTHTVPQSNSQESRAYVDRVTDFVRQLSDEVLRLDGTLRVVVTLRADFVPHCIRIPELKNLLQDRQLLLSDLASDEGALRELIQRPAQDVGALLESGLVEVLLADVRQQAGALPLLGHVLSELWRLRRGPWLTLSDYNATGGVRGAVEKRAEDSYARLTVSQQRTARRIFVKLVSLEEGTENTRRRIHRQSLYSDVKDNSDVESVLNYLVGPESRLIVAESDSLSIAHEAVIQNWRRLQTWLIEDRALERTHRDLERAATAWTDHLCSDGYLLHPESAQLATIEEHSLQLAERLSHAEQQFLTASRNKRDAQAKRLHRQSQLASGVALFTLILSLIAVFEWRQATVATTKAELQLDEAHHNLGLALLERADKFRQEEKYSRAYLAAGRAIGFADCGGPLTAYPSLLRRDTEEYLRAYTIARQSAPHAIWPTNRIPVQNDWVWAVAIAPDATHLAAAATPHEICIYDLGTNLIVKRLTGATNEVMDLQFNNDGTKLASSHRGGELRLWTLSSGASDALLGHKGEVYRTAFSPDGRFLASSGVDKSARIWDARSGAFLHQPEDFDGQVQGIAFSPDSALFAAGTDSGEVFIFNTASWQLVNRFHAHSNRIWTIAFHPDGRRFATGSGDHSVKMWMLTDVMMNMSPTPLDTLHGHTDQVFRITFSTDGKRLAAASWDKTVRIWDGSTLQSTAVLDGFNERVDGLAFAPDSSSRLATTTKGDPIRIWNLPASDDRPLCLTGHTATVSSVTTHPNGRLLASGSWDKSVRLWEIKTGLGVVLYLHRDRVSTVQFSHSGKKLFVGGADGSVLSLDVPEHFTEDMARDMSNLARVDTIAPPAGVGWISRIAINAEESLLAAACNGGGADIYDIRTGKHVMKLHAHDNRVLDVRFSVNGDFLFTSGADGIINEWDARTWNSVRTFSSHVTGKADQDVGIAISSDGHRLFSTGWDGRICETNLHTGVTRCPLDTKGEPFYNPIVVNRDSTRVAVASFDRTIRVWDLVKRRQVQILPENSPYLFCLELGNDNRWLTYSSESGVIKYLEMTPSEPPLLDAAMFSFDGLDVVFSRE